MTAAAADHTGSPLVAWWQAREPDLVWRRMRCGWGCLLGAEAITRLGDVPELYSAAGHAAPPFGGLIPLPPVWLAYVMHLILLAACLGLIVHWRPRLSSWLALGCLLCEMLLDQTETLNKAAVLMCHGLFWSGWAVPVSYADADRAGEVPRWPRYVFLLLLCQLYWSAALTKWLQPAFLNGDLLEFALLSHHNGGTSLGRWLIPYWPWFPTLAWGILIFEALVPCLIWWPRLRFPVYVSLVLFHGGLILTLGLWIFSATMLVSWLALFDACRPQPSPPRSSLWTPVLIAACLLAVLCSSRPHFSMSDISARTTAELPAVSHKDLQRWQAQLQPPEEIYLQHSQLGRPATGDRVVTTDRFEPEDTVSLWLQLVVPHPEIQQELILLAPGGIEVARSRTRIAPGTAHVRRGFEMSSDLPPGRYRVLLQWNGFEVRQWEFQFREPSL